MGIFGYHAHVYFDEHSRATAAALRAKIADELSEMARVHGLIDRAIGPHPLPMFEVDIPIEHIRAATDFLERHHGGHSILVHPITGDDLADHRDNPRWIGKALPLNLKFLEDLQG